MIYIPFVPGMAYAQTFEWARRRPDVVPWPIQADDYTGYFRMLSAVWEEGGPSVIVEHDMLPADNVIVDMCVCDQPWCTSPYRASPNKNEPDLIEGLGCVKFSEVLKAEVPNLMRVVSEMAEPGLPAMIWKRLDVRIAGELRLNGYVPHTHQRSIHLHYEKADNAH
jgi:hypothetical protein